MASWQPESGLSLDEYDDLQTASHAKLMHTLKKYGELSAEWEQDEGIAFYEACPRTPAKTLELITFATEEVVTTTVQLVSELGVAS